MEKRTPIQIFYNKIVAYTGMTFFIQWTLALKSDQQKPDNDV